MGHAYYASVAVSVVAICVLAYGYQLDDHFPALAVTVLARRACPFAFYGLAAFRVVQRVDNTICHDAQLYTRAEDGKLYVITPQTYWYQCALIAHHAAACAAVGAEVVFAYGGGRNAVTCLALAVVVGAGVYEWWLYWRELCRKEWLAHRPTSPVPAV